MKKAVILFVILTLASRPSNFKKNSDYEKTENLQMTFQ